MPLVSCQCGRGRANGDLPILSCQQCCAGGAGGVCTVGEMPVAHSVVPANGVVSSSAMSCIVGRPSVGEWQHIYRMVSRAY